jgi:hypothetical protein
MIYDDEDMRFLHLYSLPLLGRAEEALEHCRKLETRGLLGVEPAVQELVRASIQNDRAACVEAANALLASRFRDPEGYYFMARALVHVGERDFGLRAMRQVVERGFHCAGVFGHDPWLAGVSGDPRFEEIVRIAQAGHDAARAAYSAEGGEALLGVPAS